MLVEYDDPNFQLSWFCSSHHCSGPRTRGNSERFTETTLSPLKQAHDERSVYSSNGDQPLLMNMNQLENSSTKNLTCSKFGYQTPISVTLCDVIDSIIPYMGACMLIRVTIYCISITLIILHRIAQRVIIASICAYTRDIDKILSLMSMLGPLSHSQSKLENGLDSLIHSAVRYHKNNSASDWLECDSNHQYTASDCTMTTHVPLLIECYHVSELLRLLIPSKYKMPVGSRKNAALVWSMASPSLGRLGTQPPAPHEPVTDRKTHTSYHTTSNRLISEHSITPGISSRLHIFAASLPQKYEITDSVPINTDGSEISRYLQVTPGLLTKADLISITWKEALLILLNYDTSLLSQLLTSSLSLSPASLKLPPLLATGHGLGCSYGTIPDIDVSHRVRCCYDDQQTYTLFDKCCHGNRTYHISSTSPYIAHNAAQSYHGSSVPEDGDESDKSKGKGPEKPHSTAAAHRNSSITGRRPLRSSSGRANSSSTSGEGDDDEEEDDPRRLEKYKSQCEASVLISSISNTTNTGQPALSNPVLEMSLLQSALSRVWDVTRNLSIFGNQKNGNLAHSTKIDLNVSVSGMSIPNDQINCSLQDVSLNVTCNNVDLRNEQLPVKGSFSLTPIKPADEKECFTGIANPDVIPVPNQSQRTPLALQGKARRTASNYLTKTGPYEVPPSALLKRQMKSKINQRRLDISPISPARKRWSSESDAAESTQPAESIKCHRIREPGRYDCSIGLKNYIYFEHNFLDMSDTCRIDKSILFKALMTALDVAEDVTPDSENSEHSVSLSWDPSEVKNHRDTSSHNITTRNCLLYLLSRLNHHTSRMIPTFTGFNGLNILHLSELNKKASLEHRDYQEDNPLPLVILHIGSSRGLNLIPRKFNRRIVDVYDIQLENFSLLIESPEAHQTMETSLASESSLQKDSANHHIVIMPCMIQYVSTNKPPLNDHADLKSDNLTDDLSDQRLQNTVCSISSQMEGPETPHPNDSVKRTNSSVAPIDMPNEPMSTMSPIPEIKVSSPPPNTEQDRFVTPPTNNKDDALNLPNRVIDPETTPVSTREPTNKAKNLKDFLKIPDTPYICSNGTELCLYPRERTRSQSFSEAQQHSKSPNSPGVRRRHTSEGEDHSKNLSPEPQGYIRYDNPVDGLYHCADRPFHLVKKFLKKVPKTLMSRQMLADEIKQSILDKSPGITPGTPTHSHTDVSWEDTEIVHNNEDQQWCALKTVVKSINQHILETTGEDPKYNGMRLIYASDRSVKVKIKAVNKENLPLVALHIGKPKDLSIAPKKFSPKSKDIICDINMGNYSLVIFPNSSLDYLKLFFATQKNAPVLNDEQLILIPFYKKNVTAGPTQKIQCNADATIPPSKAADIENSRLASDHPPKGANIKEQNDETSSSNVDNIGISTAGSSIEDGGPIKLHHTTPELLKSVINNLKKSALKEWAASCSTVYSNNQALNKKRLCELLDSCTTGNNAKTFPLLALLTSKLDDCSVKMELLANKQSISLTAASRKQDLIDYYSKDPPRLNLS